MTRILGIDPGLGGALALLANNADDTPFQTAEVITTLDIRDMPVHALTVGRSTKRILDETALAAIVRDLKPDRACVEWVHAMPKQGVTSMFTFGMSFGAVRGVLAALQVPVTYVTPQDWQRRVKLTTKGKDAARQRAIQLFPKQANLFGLVKHSGRADAALIALAYM